MPQVIDKPTVKIRATTEPGIVKALKLNGESLDATDHKAIASAARVVSKSLRKSNPQLASHLYYVAFKHSGAAKRAARKSVKNAVA